MEIQGLSFGVNPVNKKENVFGDDIAFVEQFDFSTANMSQEHRIHAISAVASICYQNPKALGSESLYNRLMAESIGLPSSSFEMCPVLIPLDSLNSIKFLGKDTDINNILKFSEIITHKDKEYLLTNYRAIVYDVENKLLTEDALKFFNTKEECEIIKQYFKVFKYKVDLPTRSQMVRHRCSWQELCISGDSKITTSQGTRTIKELYEIQQRQKSKYSDVKYPSIKCYDEDKGLFVKAKIKEVFYTGKKEVLEVNIQFGSEGKNRIIKSTKDHKFLTNSGWKALEDIAIGEYVAINGKPCKQTIKFGMLISKDLVGIEDTYDMEIDHKSHNYVANKIVVHNSRRYVSGSRVPFEFYVSEKLKENEKVQELIKQSEDLYFELLENGVKPEEARRVLMQSAYTQLWGAFMPKQLDNFFKLRLDKSAQWEIRQTSIAMQELIQGDK